MKTKKKQRFSRSENKQIRTKKKNKRRIKDKNNQHRRHSSKERNKNDKKLTNRKKRRPVKKTIKGGSIRLDKFFEKNNGGGLFTLNKELTFTYTIDNNTKNELKLGKKGDYIIFRRVNNGGNYLYLLITNDHYYTFEGLEHSQLDVIVDDKTADQNQETYLSNNLTFVVEENIPQYPVYGDSDEDMKTKLFNLVNYVRGKNGKGNLDVNKKGLLDDYNDKIKEKALLINKIQESIKKLNAETPQLTDKPSTPSGETLVQQQGQDNPSSAIVPVNKQIIPQDIPQNIPQDNSNLIYHPDNKEWLHNLLPKSGELVPYSKNNNENNLESNENNLELNEYINNLWEILKKKSKVPEIQIIEDDKGISPINEEPVDIKVIEQVIIDIVNRSKFLK